MLSTALAPSVLAVLLLPRSKQQQTGSAANFQPFFNSIIHNDENKNGPWTCLLIFLISFYPIHTGYEQKQT
jgi:hypothetical protein